MAITKFDAELDQLTEQRRREQKRESEWRALELRALRGLYDMQRAQNQMQMHKVNLGSHLVRKLDELRGTYTPG